MASVPIAVPIRADRAREATRHRCTRCAGLAGDASWALSPARPSSEAKSSGGSNRLWSSYLPRFCGRFAFSIWSPGILAGRQGAHHRGAELELPHCIACRSLNRPSVARGGRGDKDAGANRGRQGVCLKLRDSADLFSSNDTDRGIRANFDRQGRAIKAVVDPRVSFRSAFPKAFRPLSRPTREPSRHGSASSFRSSGGVPLSD
jgi:hypothetical protein